MSEPLPPRLPKLCGADIELANFILGHPGGDSGAAASRALLAEFDGLPKARGGAYSYSSHSENWSYTGCRTAKSTCSSSAWDPQDWGRKYLRENGSCVYVDLDHIELCLPETLSAWDHASAWHAMLRLTHRAMDSANERMTSGRSIQVLVNNTDGHGHSYGSHLNFLITQRAWDNIVWRKPHYLGFLASFQVSSIVYTGQGKVGAENGAPDVPFQLSQRADFFETLVGTQTTFNRPIVNSRAEHLTGPLRPLGDGTAPARLHCIFFDNTLAHLSCLLKVGTMQLMLAMIEAERVNPALVLDDPLAALTTYSHDLSLRSRARLASGSESTAVDLQFMFLEDAKRFAGEGGFDGIVPRAQEILELWEDTLLRLQANDWAGLAPKLDWVMKLSILKRALSQRPSLDWDSPEIRHLDQVYASLDPESGLYRVYERAGFAERLLDEDRIRHFCSEPPENTRAWARAMLLRAVPEEWVDAVNWDSLSFRLLDGSYWPARRTIDMPDPLGMTAAETGPLVAGACDFAELLDAIANAADAAEVEKKQQAVN